MAKPPDSTIGVAQPAVEAPRGEEAPSWRPGNWSERPDYPALSLIPPEHYVMKEQLARGGMGRVIRARDRRLGRDVAIKAVARKTPDLLIRLEREARIMARLHHPAIVTVHEAGVWPGQEPFYAMELVAGRPLGEAIASTTSFAERLALLPHAYAAADALAYAHAQRIIHRDLKPSNVLVGEFGETVVIDWGLAKDLADPKAHDDTLPQRTATRDAEQTIAGAILGTPAYMPPEQAEGGTVDERADVYALGAMLYHVLAGAPPYTGVTSDEILAAVRKGPPRPVEELAPETPPDLITIVAKAMRPSAKDRYPSARELAVDLRHFRTGQLVGSHRYTIWELLTRWLRRHRAVVSVATVLVAVLVAVSVISVQRIVHARSVAEEQRAAAEQSAERARAAEQRAQGDLEALKTEQAARTKAELEARASASVAEMSKEQLQDALTKAQAERRAAEDARAHAEQESARARDAEQRAEKAAATEKDLRQELQKLLEAEKARVKALEEAPAKGITTRLSK